VQNPNSCFRGNWTCKVRPFGKWMLMVFMATCTSNEIDHRKEKLFCLISKRNLNANATSKNGWRQHQKTKTLRNPCGINFPPALQNLPATTLAALTNRQTQWKNLAVYSQTGSSAVVDENWLPAQLNQLALQHQIPVEQPSNFQDWSDRKHFVSYQARSMICGSPNGLLLPQRCF